MNRALVLLLSGAALMPLSGRADDIYRHCGRYGAGIARANGISICIIDHDRMQKDQEMTKLSEAERQARRTVDDDFLAECRSRIKFRLKDPSSFKEWFSTVADGGLIDYTAANSYGGPNRETIRCTTMQTLRD